MTKEMGKTMTTRIIPAVKFSAIACVAVLAACSNAKDSSGDANEATTTQAVSAPAAATLSAYKLVRHVPTQADVAEQAGRMVRALGADATAEQTLRAAVKGATPATASVHAQANTMTVSYIAGNGSVDMVDEAVTGDLDSKGDIGAEAAKRVFLSRFDALAANAAVDTTGLKTANAKLFPIMQGQGMTGRPEPERVKEYVYAVPRILGGVEVFNAGVEVSVHRNGKVARTRSFGPTVQSERAAAEYTFSQTVSSAAAEARVKKDHPGAEIKTIGLRYWLPEGVSEQVVVPQHMYLVVRHSQVEGHDVAARGVYVAYSAQDPTAEPTVWPKANPAGASTVTRTK